jgi:1-acyl-sn-glycerol-3-phosphate acyltransferase
MLYITKRFKPFKGLIYFIVGLFTYHRLALVNRIEINGAEVLKKLPRHNVLFVSNHQTYFADVIAFVHIFLSIRWHKNLKGLGIPYYLLNPFKNVHFVAAEETMKANWISRLFALGGAVTVKRTWRAEGKDVARQRDTGDTEKITDALKHSWVISFPQGTTKPFAPGRKGTGFIIKETQPIVVPVVIQGFWRAFNKTGLKFKKRNTQLQVTFKEPLNIDYNNSAEHIVDQIMDAIEQSKKYMAKGKHHLLALVDK